MKRKLLAVALAAAMTVTSVGIVSAVEKTDKITGDLTVTTFFKEKTNAVEFKSGDQYTFTFHNKSNGTNNWDNYILAITGAIGDAYTGADQEVMWIRADNYGEGKALSDFGTLNFETNIVWENWVAGAKAGYDCEVTVGRDGDTIVYDAKIGEYYDKLTATSGKELPESCYIFFTGENCELTNFATEKKTGFKYEPPVEEETTTAAPAEEETTTAAPAEEETEESKSTLEDGLKAYYTFDGTLINDITKKEATLHVGSAADDSVDTFNTAEATGKAQYDKGQNGNAYSFGGNVDGVNADGLKADVALTKAFTISYWANMRTSSFATSMIFSPTGDNEGLSIADEWIGTGFPSARIWGTEVVPLVKNPAGEEEHPDIVLNPETSYKDNTWTYITLTCYEEGDVVLYINGEIVKHGEVPQLGRINPGVFEGVPVYLGINHWDNTFDGLMDDLVIYDRALSDEEVAELYGENGVPYGSEITPLPPTPEEETTAPTDDNRETTAPAGEEETKAPADNNGAAGNNNGAGSNESVDQPAQTGDVVPYMILVLGAAAAAIVAFARKREEA